ncbi:neprilysin-21-like [Amblyomma americanum]
MFVPSLLESPERRDSALAQRGDSSVSSHGWYQPLHIASQGSRSSSMGLAELGERSSFAAALFLNFAWRAPEAGPPSGSAAPRSLPETSGSASVDGPRETDRFAWSSKALLMNREPTTTHEFKPPDEDVSEEQEPSAASSQPEESPKAADSPRKSKSSSSQIALDEQKTKMLRSATSDTDVAPEQVHEEAHEEVQEEAPEVGEEHEEDEDDDQSDAESDGKKKKKKKRKKKKKEVAASGDAEAVEQAEAEEEEEDEEEHISLAEFEGTKKKKTKPVPVAVPAQVSEITASKPGQKEDLGPTQAPAEPQEQPQEEPEDDRNSETGVFEANAAREASFSPTWPQAPPQTEPAIAAPQKSGVESGAVSPAEPLVIAEFSLAKLDELDRESEQMEKDMAELELTPVELYPESRLVIILAILCLLWIIFLIIVASMKHGPYPTSEGECTTKPGPTFPPPPWTVRTTVWRPPEWSTVQRSTVTRMPPTQVSGSTATTEETLHGIFICSTEYCQRDGNYLRDLTTQSKKKPCDDFYGHVCGAWKNSNSRLLESLPGAAVSTDTLLQSSMEAELLAYIKDKRNANVAPARALYSLCVRKTDADSALQDVKYLFRQWGSKWPHTDRSKNSPADVWHFAAKLMRVLGLPSLVGVEIGLDPWNLEENIIEVCPPSTIFFSNDVSNERVMTLFTSAVRTAAKLLNPQDTVSADAAAEDVRIALSAISARKLEDLGSSPLDFVVDKLDSLGKGVQAFLRAVFENVTTLEARSRLLVRRGPLFRQELDKTVDTAPPRAMLNYLGLLVLVALSPFLPEELRDLRVLHSVHTLGRAEKGSNELMCLRAVSQAYPACLSEASQVLHKNTHRSVWLSQLETVFAGFVRDVAWMDNLTSLFVRYKMRHHHLARFFPAWPLGNCSATTQGGTASKAIGAFVEAVSQRQLEQLQQLTESPLQLSTGSPLAVWPRYRLCLQLFQIPVGLVNGSVPANGTLFALHLSRLAVRLYAALAQLFYAGTVYELEIPLYFTNAAAETLDDLLDCLVANAKNKFPHGLSPDRVRNALLEQVLALQMGFLAFRRLLTVRRIWRQDFRLSTFPEMSADQLFFLYYALDNCELSDAVFQSHEFEAHRRLPAAMRVNMALRQSAQFAQAFQCRPGEPMVAEEKCQVLR